MLVKDYKGTLISREKARKIKNEFGEFHYYEMGVSCVQMEDGQWYRTTTNKILFDHSTGKWIFKDDFKGREGIVSTGEKGWYSDDRDEVTVASKAATDLRKKSFDLVTKEVKDGVVREGKWVKQVCISEKVALALGYSESINDGIFYDLKSASPEDKAKMKTPSIPQQERHSTYSLDDDKDYRSHLEHVFDSQDTKIDPKLKRLARKHAPFTFGIELEVQNGFVPKRIRERHGFRTCRDGSLNHTQAGEQDGQEYVSIPLDGGRGLHAIKEMCRELTKRCELSNKCSVHLHFGDVRRDRLYVVSLWNLLFNLQDDLRKYFPYSRTNSIREDGKIYAALLPNLNLKVENILGSKSDETFKKRVTEEFSKIYTWLNNGAPVGTVYEESFVRDTREAIIKGKPVKQYCYRVKKFNFTTKLPRHAIQGHKWLRPQRYLFVNFLNFFFAHSKTIEFRVHEATTNFDKILMYLLTCVAILKYAEKFDKTLTNKPITLEEVINDSFPSSSKLSSKIMFYWNMRKSKFCNPDGSFNSNWKAVEAAWLAGDHLFNYSA